MGEDGNWREVDDRLMRDGFTKENITKGCRCVALVLKIGVSDNCASPIGKLANLKAFRWRIAFIKPVVIEV